MEAAASAPTSVWDEAVRIARSRFASIEGEKLAAFIASQPDVRGPVSVEKLTTLGDGSGISNGIAFFEAIIDRGTGPARETLVLRYDPGVTLFRQKSYEDEFLTMKAARKAGLPVPQVHWLDREGSAIGAIGFIMERVEGDAPATAMFTRGPFANLSPADLHRIMLEPAGFHGQLRKAAIGADETPHLLARGSGDSALERELGWWLKEAEFVTDADDPRFQRVKSVHDWLKTHRPALREATLVHGDAQHCNTIFRNGKPAAVIDWEFAHLGYAETDIMMMVLTTEIMAATDKAVEGTPTEADYIARYEAASGQRVEHWPYFKLCMAYRYLVGQIVAAATFPNAAQMWTLVDGIIATCLADAERAFNTPT